MNVKYYKFIPISLNNTIVNSDEKLANVFELLKPFSIKYPLI